MADISVVCPGCATTFPMGGLLDFGFLPDSGFPQGITEATLGMDCPSCRTHLDVRWTAAWRQPT